MANRISDRTWGGSRPGSGRKSKAEKDKRAQMTVTIDRDTRDRLKAMAKEQHVRVGRLVDEWVSGTFYL